MVVILLKMQISKIEVPVNLTMSRLLAVICVNLNIFDLVVIAEK